MARAHELFCAGFLVAASACGRDNSPPPAPVPSRGPVSVSAPGASAAAPASSSAPVVAAPSTTASAAPIRAAPAIVGSVVRFETGPAVVLKIGEAETRLVGIDGKALAWRMGDTIAVDSPAQPGSNAIDCSDASQCSVGLRSGGDVILRDVDAHVAARLLTGLGAHVVVAGASRRAWVELRAPTADVLVRSAAAAFGLGIRRHRGLTLLASPSILAAAQLRRVPANMSRRVDLGLVAAGLDNVTRLLSDVGRTPMTGALSGRISVAARDVESADLVDACFGLCGVEATAKAGALTLKQAGQACAQPEYPAPRCPQKEGDSVRDLVAGLHCLEPARLRVLALRVGQFPEAVLGEGRPHGDEILVRERVYLGQSQRVSAAGAEYEINWQVDKIDRSGVELVFKHKPAGIQERRLKIPLP